MWMREPLLSLHVSCVNLGLQLALFFLEAIRSEKHKVVVQAPDPPGKMFVLSHSVSVCVYGGAVCVCVCVYITERETGTEVEGEKRHNIIAAPFDHKN